MDFVTCFYGVCTFKCMVGFSKGHPVYKTRTYTTRLYTTNSEAYSELRHFIDEMLPLFSASLVDYSVYARLEPSQSCPF